MKSKKSFGILVSYLVASQVLSSTPASAAGNEALNNLNSYLAAIAAKNGMIYINAAGPAPHHSAGGTLPLPTKEQMVEAIHNLPKPITYPDGPPIPTPTPEEALTLIPPPTDPEPVVINGQTVYPMFGTITSADETLTGEFEDLSQVDLSQFEPEVDPSLFEVPDDTISDLGSTPTGDLIASVLPSRSLELSAPIDLLQQNVEIASSGDALQFSGTVDGAMQQTAAVGILASPSIICGPMELATAAAPQSEQKGVRLVASPESGACLIADDSPSDVMLRGYVMNEAAGCPSEIQSGAAFLHPKHDQVVQLPNGNSLQLKGDAFAWVEAGQGFIKVRSGSLGVRVNTACGSPVKLGAGEEVVLVSTALSAQDPLLDGLAKRHIAHHKLVDGTNVYLSEFSIMHFVSRENCFTQSEFGAIRGRLLKSAAAISIACRHHGRYYLPIRSKLPKAAYCS